MVYPMKHCFSVDVEDWYHVENLASALPSDKWAGCERRVRQNMERLLSLLEEENLKATCFILGAVAREFPGLVKLISENGHEIASHGEDHKRITAHNKESFRGTVDNLKKHLEDLSGQEVIGYRAPTFSIMNETWWALEILAECGYRYDSSVFPFKRERYGVEGAPVDPYKISLENGSTLVEFPPSVIDLGFKTLPIAGGGYFRLYPAWFTNWAVNRLEKNGRVFCFYMHPWEIDPGQPRIEQVSFLNKKMHYLNLHSTEKKLRKVLKKYRFQPYGSYYKENKHNLEFKKVNE